MKTILFTFLLCILPVQISNAQWVQVNNGMGDVYVQSLGVKENNIFAGTIGYGLYLSSDNGLSWTQTSLNKDVWSFAVSGSNIFAGTSQYGVYLSTDNGTSWTQTSLTNRNVYSLVINGNNILAGCGVASSISGVYLSSDNGTSWTRIYKKWIYTLAVSGSNIFAGSSSEGVLLSTNNGLSWTQTSLTQGVYRLAINGNNIFAGTNGSGIYVSTDNGTTWAQTSLNNAIVYTFAVNGNNIIAGTIGSGVYVSTNNGASWTQRNDGMTGLGLNIRSVCILNNYIFAGSYGSSVFRRPLNELIGIQPISNEIPNQFSLSQNYPNPFNPSTKIRFQVARTPLTPLSQRGDNVRLVVFDVLGKEVATLVNEQLKPGTYEVDFDGSKFASGVYYYKLVVSPETSSGFVETKKMILIK